ncbi:hypothetical protein Vretimale_1184 [Volvox reticuliferus]|uniref:Uncharacterized protein n=1 Tax=Volvox reticuliferus TaxID=1737510 RepID=A0A8J4D8N6_9CHLO|nr:hypothetical protein Vretimale_1184 [Volvox reticuliferus]
MLVADYLQPYQYDAPYLSSPMVRHFCTPEIRDIIVFSWMAVSAGYGRSFCTRTMVIIADDAADGKAALSGNQLAALGSLPGALTDRIFLLRVDPRDPGDLEKLNLKPGGSVAAVLVPNTEQFAAGTVKGAAPALADGQMLVAAAALRRYCDQMGCRLRVVAEVLALLNCSYALPLCLEEGPYHTDNLAGTQQLHSYRRPSSSPTGDPERTGTASGQVKFITDPRPDFRRGVRMTLERLRRSSDQVLQEEFVQEMLSQMPHLAPSLASGHILMETFMDALACQSIFNPMILQILLKMLDCWTPAPTHQRRARLQNQHSHHQSHDCHPQQFQHQHHKQKQARALHRRQQSHLHKYHQYGRYLQLRQHQHPQARQRPPQVSPSHSGKERPASRGITMGVPIVATSPSGAVVATSPRGTAPSSSSPSLEGGLERSQVSSQHYGAAAVSIGDVTGPAVLNPIPATGCQIIRTSLAVPGGDAAGTVPQPGHTWLTTSELSRTQPPPPPPPPPPAVPVQVLAPSSLQRASYDKATGMDIPESGKAATMVVVVMNREDGTRTHVCDDGPGQRAPGPMAEATEEALVPQSSPPPLPPRQLSRYLTDLEKVDNMHGNCNSARGGEEDNHNGSDGDGDGDDGQMETGVSVPAVLAAVAGTAGSNNNYTMGIKDGSGAAHAKASATAAATVRLFSLSYREMIQRIPGLRELLHSVQESQQLQQPQQQLQNPNSSPCNAGLSWSWSRMMDPISSVSSNREAPKQLQFHQRGPSRSISFGVLFEVLVEEYDMMPLALYRRDHVGGAADVSRFDEPRSSGGVRESCPSSPQLPLGLDGRTACRVGNLAAAGKGQQVRADRCAPPVATASGLPYVYTKPEKYDTWLRDSDDVYLLASQVVVMRFWGPHP